MIDPLQHPRAAPCSRASSQFVKHVLSQLTSSDFRAAKRLSNKSAGRSNRQGVPAQRGRRIPERLFVLDAYADFLSAYADLWEELAKETFGESWNSLQEALGLLRVIKRFSDIDVSFFERQLLELEQAYPYGVFASVGMLVERFDCSICGLDIDSDGCPHRRGQLYRGVMAYGIVRNIIWATMSR